MQNSEQSRILRIPLVRQWYTQIARGRAQGLAELQRAIVNPRTDKDLLQHACTILWSLQAAKYTSNARERSPVVVDLTDDFLDRLRQIASNRSERLLTRISTSTTIVTSLYHRQFRGLDLADQGTEQGSPTIEPDAMLQVRGIKFAFAWTNLCYECARCVLLTARALCMTTVVIMQPLVILRRLLARDIDGDAVVMMGSGLVITLARDIKTAAGDVHDIICDKLKNVISIELGRTSSHQTISLKYPGMQCDACGRTESAVTLQKCTRCEMAWFCSKECQLTDWRDPQGHARLICSKGLTPGDFVTIRNIRPVVHGLVAIRADDEEGSVWSLANYDDVIAGRRDIPFQHVARTEIDRDVAYIRYNMGKVDKLRSVAPLWSV